MPVTKHLFFFCCIAIEGAPGAHPKDIPSLCSYDSCPVTPQVSKIEPMCPVSRCTIVKSLSILDCPLQTYAQGRVYRLLPPLYLRDSRAWSICRMGWQL